MKIDKNTKPLMVVENAFGQNIEVFDMHFISEKNRFAVLWFAKHENGSYGFLIDGKRLCFKYLNEQVWEDIQYGDWLDELRKRSDNES